MANTETLLDLASSYTIPVTDHPQMIPSQVGIALLAESELPTETELQAILKILEVRNQMLPGNGIVVTKEEGEWKYRKARHLPFVGAYWVILPGSIVDVVDRLTSF